MKESVFLRGDDYTTWGSQRTMWGQFLFNLADGSTLSSKEPTQRICVTISIKTIEELGNLRTFFIKQVAWNLAEVCEPDFEFDNWIFFS